MRDRNIEIIQALRGLAVLGVVLFHTLAIERKYAGDSWLPGFFGFGELGVDLFFVISGFIMVTITHSRFAGAGDFARFLYSRVTRIYPTYWFYFFLLLPVVLVRPEWVNASQGHQVDIISSFLLLPSEQLPILLVAWSLIHELWFYLVFALLLLVVSRQRLLFALLLWALVVAAANVLANPMTLSPGLRIALHPLTLEFIFGALAALAVRAGFGTAMRPALLRLGGLVAICAAVLAYLSGYPKDHLLIRALLFGSSYAAILLCCVALERRGALAAPRFLRWLGDASYTVYLSHVLVISVIGRVWLAIGPQAGAVDNLVAFSAMLLSVIAYGWIGFKLVENPLVGLSHRMRDRLFPATKPVAPEDNGEGGKAAPSNA